MPADEDTDESITKQVLSLLVDNAAIRDTAFPYLTGYIVFNVLILALLIYISIRISLKP